MTSIAIVGGGPAGYEAALVAAQLGAEVTLIEPDGLGGACVLYDRGSTNGTYVNGVRVTQTALQHGLVIKIGSTELTFLAE